MVDSEDGVPVEARFRSNGKSGIGIGQLAALAGVAPSTVRYYEKAGLMPTPGRRGNCRVYGADAVQRLRTIRLARSVGFGIVEIREALRGGQGDLLQRLRSKASALRRKAIEADEAASTIEAALACGCEDLLTCETLIEAA